MSSVADGVVMRVSALRASPAGGVALAYRRLGRLLSTHFAAIGGSPTSEAERRDVPSLCLRLATLQSCLYLCMGASLYITFHVFEGRSPTVADVFFAAGSGAAQHTAVTSSSVIVPVVAPLGPGGVGSSALGPSPPSSSVLPLSTASLLQQSSSSAAHHTTMGMVIVARSLVYPPSAFIAGVVSPTVRHVLDFVVTSFGIHVFLRWMFFPLASWTSMTWWFLVLLDVFCLTVAGEVFCARRDRALLMQGPLGGGPNMNSNRTNGGEGEDDDDDDDGSGGVQADTTRARGAAMDVETSNNNTLNGREGSDHAVATPRAQSIRQAFKNL